MELTLRQLRDKARHQLAALETAYRAEEDRQWAAEDPQGFFSSQVRNALYEGRTAVKAPDGVSPYDDSDLKTCIEDGLAEDYPWLTFFLDHNFTYHFKVASND